MSDRTQPSKFFVPEVPPQYISNFAEDSQTTESSLLHLLLENDSAVPPQPAVVVKGAGGTGKTTLLLGVGNEPRISHRFSDAVWFISLGKDARPFALLEDLETVVRAILGSSEAEELRRLSRSRNKSSAAAEAIRLLNDRAVLLLLDDVWADEKAHEVGRSTVFSLVQDCLRRVQRNSRNLRIVVSSRDASVAALVPDRCRICVEPFKEGDPSAGKMLCNYAEASVESIENAGLQVQESFDFVLDRCRGLQLALAVAGRGVCERIQSGIVHKDDAWCNYAEELSEMEAFLKTSHPDHPAIYPMLQSSLEHLNVCLERDGVLLSHELNRLFSFLGVLRKQDTVPLSVVQCIWGVSEQTALRLCIALERLHLVLLTKEDGVQWMRMHDVILEFCDIVLSEKPGRKSFAHRMTVERLEKKFLGSKSTDVEYEGCAPLWNLQDADVDEWARDYCFRNIPRHMASGGKQTARQLLYLLTDYRWVEARTNLSKKSMDLGGFEEDLRMLVGEYGQEMDADVKGGVELISDAARLSMPFVASNSRELGYQLAGRLNVHSGNNRVVDRFMSSLERYAKRPWLKASKGLLKAAGGPVILSASLSRRLYCVTSLPNGEDVVVGGTDGYLAVFSIQYASEMYELPGHRGTVSSVAVCTTTRRVFSCSDVAIRVWVLGTEKQTNDVFVNHERVIWSIAITLKGNRLVFGDSDGWIVLCDSTSGEVLHQWRGHTDTVWSLQIHGKDGIIVSGSSDGTIARWDSTNGQEIGTRIAITGGHVGSVAISRDGKRIAYGAFKKVGVLEASSGNVLREGDTGYSARCVIFGTDEETVHFGRVDGTTASLAPNGVVIRDVKAHSDSVFGIAQNPESQLLISVSHDFTLSVQSLNSNDGSRTAESEERNNLWSFAALADRKRVLYGWRNGPGGLQLLAVDTVSPDTALGGKELMHVSTTIGSSDTRVWAIAASCDGCWAVVGTALGQVMVYSTDTWCLRYESFKLLNDSVLTVAISSDGTFFAAGYMGGDVVLFRSEDGSQVQLSTGHCDDREITTVTFSEDCSSLLVLAYHKSRDSGMLHVWKHIDHSRKTEHIALPLEKISTWSMPQYPVAMIATTTHIATRYMTDNESCVYEFENDRYSLFSDTQGDDAGLLQLSSEEHKNLEQEGALHMEPFGRVIRYGSGPDSEELGTLEAPICYAYHPEQWTFHESNGLFVAGGYRSRFVCVLLMREDGKLLPGCSEAPTLHPIWRHTAPKGHYGGLGTTGNREFKVFISHAGPDKADVAIPLYKRLEAKGIRAFVDMEELRVGEDAPEEMQRAMNDAGVGVFILSPEFAGRRWPLKELLCFLGRFRRSKGRGARAPALIPVFYRLGVRDCQSDNLYRPASASGKTIFQEGFFDTFRQNEIPTSMAEAAMTGVTRFTGIENREGAKNDSSCWDGLSENQELRDRLLEKIAVEVEMAVVRQETEGKTIQRCVIA